MNRHRPDRCPGALRPWPADDGLLVRLRIPGGRVSVPALHALVDVAELHGDGRVRTTVRTNLQVRAMPSEAGTDRLPEEVLALIEATGLLPSRTHDLARNIMASPQTGIVGGRADLQPVVAALDGLIRADPLLGQLPGRFLFVLDDGRGDLLARSCDLGLVALGETAQLRIGDGWGPVVPLADAPRLLADLARDFLAARGVGADAAWHVDELSSPLIATEPPSRQIPEPAAPLPFGLVPGGSHEEVPGTGIDREAVVRWKTLTPDVVITPWHGVLIPEEHA